MTLRSSEVLFEMLDKVAPFPEGVEGIPHPLPAISFFPVGSGLLPGKQPGVPPEFPFGKIMVMGQDWGTRQNFDDLKIHGGNNLRGPTWRNVLSLLGRIGIERSDCFFTNFFMGLRTAEKSTGKFPGAKDVHFVERCQAFFAEQIRYQKPKLLLVLGGHVPPLLASFSERLIPWSRFKTFKAIDEAGLGCIRDVRIPGTGDSLSAVVLLHPSMRGSNKELRTWRAPDGGIYRGDEAELRMVKDALAEMF